MAEVEVRWGIDDGQAFVEVRDSGPGPSQKLASACSNRSSRASAKASDSDLRSPGKSHRPTAARFAGLARRGLLLSYRTADLTPPPLYSGERGPGVRGLHPIVPRPTNPSPHPLSPEYRGEGPITIGRSALHPPGGSA